MPAVIERLSEFIKEVLTGWITSNLQGMFTDVNDKVGTIAAEVGQTPSTWNGSIFSMVQSLSDTVIVPIAGMVITAVLCYELINAVISSNAIHDQDVGVLFKYLFKAGIAVWLLSHTSDMVLGIFDIGSYVVSQAGRAISGSTNIDVEATLESILESQVDSMGIGELIGLGMETMIVSFAMKIMSVLITVILYGRMMEIYLYVSVAPIPMATLGNHEWGSIGTNYVKGVAALAFQGFFMMVCVGIYAALVSSISVAQNLHSALWGVAGYTVLLCFMLFKTGTISQSIFNSR